MGAEAVWTSAIAVMGTLLGSATTYLFQRQISRQGEAFSRSESLRQELVGVYSAYAAAVEDFRRGQADRWYRKLENPGGESDRVARDAAHRLRAVARQELYRVKLLTRDPELLRMAEQALQCIRDVSNASSEDERGALDDLAKAAIEEFVSSAALRLR